MRTLQVAGIIFTIAGGVYLFMKISQSGIDKIKRHEALRLEPYQDEGGKWTIGYGHLLRSGEWYDRITEEKAEELLRQDLATAENAVKQLVKVPISQNQHDALVSFVFNIGVTAFSKSTLLRKLNAGDAAGAANEFSRWKYVQGQVSTILIARRKREQLLFLA